MRGFFERLYAQVCPLVRSLFGQSWARFGVVGVTSTAVYFLTGLAFEYAGLPVLVGNAAAYLLGFIVSYFGHKLWSFPSAVRHSGALPRFIVVWFAGLLLNTLIIWLGIRLGLAYIVAMCAAIAFVPLFTYFVNRFWVFRHLPVRGAE